MSTARVCDGCGRIQRRDDERAFDEWWFLYKGPLRDGLTTVEKTLETRHVCSPACMALFAATLAVAAAHGGVR